MKRAIKMPCTTIWGATLVVVPAALLSATMAWAFDHEGLALRARERHIVPGYERLASAGAVLSAAIAGLCEAPGSERLTEAKDAFKGALMAWGRIEHIRFGPIAEHNRLDAMLFWPDVRGIARRQIARVLTQRDADALVPSKLMAKSVAVQGFSALDVALFGPGSDALATRDNAGRFRCGYARALAANIETVARETHAGWSDARGFGELWSKPGPGNRAFLTPKETTHALVQAYLTGLKQVRNVRLGGPLGLKERGIRPLEPIVPNSGLAFELIVANVEGLRALLMEPDLASAFADGERGRSIIGAVGVELDMTIARMRQVAEASPRALQDAAARVQLLPLGFALRNAHEALSNAVSEAAGLSMGFNALDGD
jgi:uncharacterized protein